MTETEHFFDLPLGEEADRFPTVAELRSLLELMRPHPSPVPLCRFGGTGDGAYLLPADLEGVTDCLSPGVENRKDFEDELALRHGIRSHLCDASSDPERLRTPLIDGLQSFQAAWLAPEPGPGRLSIAQWVEERNACGAGDLMLQMDIEGAEYRNLLLTPRGILSRFRILLIEFHGLRALRDSRVFRQIVRPVMEKLARDFHCVHAHGNNACGVANFGKGIEGIPDVLELSFLRRDRMRGHQWFPVCLPHPLDIVNVPGRAPLHLGPGWSGGSRHWRARMKVLGDRWRWYRERRQGP